MTPARVRDRRTGRTLFGHRRSLVRADVGAIRGRQALDSASRTASRFLTRWDLFVRPVWPTEPVFLRFPLRREPITQQEYRRLFRMTITDRETGAQMADYAAARRYGRVAIYYIRNAYGRSLANAFEERAIERGIAIVDRQSYDPNAVVGERAVTDILTSWGDLHLDAIFAAAEPRQAAAMIGVARAMGIGVPVLGGDAIAVGQFLESGGAAVEGTVLAAIFHPDDPRPAARRFSAAFQRRHGGSPDASAALAYDAMYLLARGISAAATTESGSGRSGAALGGRLGGGDRTDSVHRDGRPRRSVGRRGAGARRRVRLAGPAARRRA